MYLALSVYLHYKMIRHMSKSLNHHKGVGIIQLNGIQQQNANMLLLKAQWPVCKKINTQLEVRVE